MVSIHEIFGKGLKLISPKTYNHIVTEHNNRSLIVQAVIEFQEALVDNINPKKLYQECVHIFKKYGVAIGLVVTAIELLDHFGIPLILAYFGFKTLAVIFTTLPISELFIYPVILFVVKKTRKGEQK